MLKHVLGWGSVLSSLAGCSFLVDTERYTFAAEGIDAGVDAGVDADGADAEPMPPPDPCGGSLCPAHARCEVAGDGIASCVCESGYRVQGAECVDIDECATEPVRCAQLCVNTPGAYRCDCRIGYVAAEAACVAAPPDPKSAVISELGDPGDWTLAFDRRGSVHLVHASTCSLRVQTYSGRAWSPSVEIRGGRSCPRSPVAAMNRGGQALVLWREEDKSDAGIGVVSSVWARRYPVATPGDGAAPTMLSVGDAYDAPLAATLNEAGLAVGTWSSAKRPPFDHTVFASTSTPTRAWQRSELRPSSGGFLSSKVLCGYDAAGTVLTAGLTVVTYHGPAAWTWLRVFDGEVWKPQPALELSYPSSSLEGKLVIAPSGEAGALLWSVRGLSLFERRYARGAWAGSAEALRPSPEAFDVAAAEASIVAVFVDGGRVWAIERATSGAWSEPVALATSPTTISTPLVAVDARGSALAVWVQRDGGHDEVWGAMRAAGSRWQTAQRIVPGGGILGPVPRLAVAPLGDYEMLLAWEQSEYTSRRLWSQHIVVLEPR